jgi:hypothetical protein
VIDPTRSNWNDPLIIKGLQFPVSMIQEGIAMPSNAPRVSQRYFYHRGSAMTFADGPGIIGGSLKGTGIRYNIAPQLRGPANAGTEITVNAWEIVDAGMQTNYMLGSTEIGAIVNPVVARMMLGEIPIESGTTLIYEQLTKFSAGM